MRNLRHELVHPAIPSSADTGRESKLATPRLDAEARRTPSGIAAMACDHPNLDSTNETVTATTARPRLAPRLYERGPIVKPFALSMSDP